MADLASGKTHREDPARFARAVAKIRVVVMVRLVLADRVLPHSGRMLDYF